MQQNALRNLNETDYLEMEADSPVRHEFVGGQAYAMAGASVRHNRIAGKLYASLLAQAPRNCQVLIGDVKLKADTWPTYYYPDVMVVCDPDDDDPLVKTRPCLLAEVLSPTTEAIDRREKLTAYQRLPSLREYLLIAQDEIRVERYRRLNLREWMVEIHTPGDILKLDCVHLELPVEALYDGLDTVA
ncbi:MAG: Uma2 family endonuclease [Pseudomonadota bacterium]|nr:Uma2 family endonuclease [Pseudomonadota bacterium]MDP1902795.1 Uma2 family endonuclease [Pseudomonadota bacterium]MDP2354069.1 Uma2 family endonuclease [Pseudomonadota bacterium]